MRGKKLHQGGSVLRALLLAAVLAALGLSAGAAVPDSARADDDDNGYKRGNSQICSQPGGGTQTKTVDPLTGRVIAVTQECTITASVGVCIQHATAPLVVQKCIVNQGPTPTMPVMRARDNSITVIQIADQRGAEGTLDATQIVDGPLPLTQGEQRNTTRNNTAFITQVIEQKLKSGSDDDDDNGDEDDEDDDDNGDENGPPELADLIEQFEQAHQSVDLCQGGVLCDSQVGMTGKNRSTVFQSETQHEFAANATVILQEQNTELRLNECSPGPGPQPDDVFARICYTITQHTSNASQNPNSPANYSKLKQFNDQIQTARNAGGGHQAKGSDPDDGGLDHSFVQFTPPPGATAGIARLFSDQDEYQTQRKINSPFMTQGQFGNIRKGSGTQDSNPNSLVDLVLDKTQYQGEGPFEGQTGSARAFARTSGECIADVTVTQNGVSETAQEPGGDKTPAGDFCAEFVLCGDAFGEEFPSPPEGDNCVSSDDPCPEGQIRDPISGLCEFPPCEICLTSVNTGGSNVLALKP